MNTEKAFKLILLLSVLPLFFALFLSVYFWLNLADLTHASFKLARLNSYIYAHSYGALLLAVFCGINIGHSIDTTRQGLFILLNFVLILMAWLGYKSFGDWQGMTLLIFCWILSLSIFRYFNRAEIATNGLYQSVSKLHIAAIVILTLITIING